MTPRFLELNDACLVCDVCYARIKSHNIAN